MTATAPSPATVEATTRAGRKSRAQRAAEKIAADQAAGATDQPTATDQPAETVAGATGRSTTGDNGVPTASQLRREAAAQPVQLATGTQSQKPAGDPTATDVKRLIATALVQAGADLATQWDVLVTLTPEDSPLRKITAESATTMINKYLSYVGTCTWDPRLPAREHPGGRGRNAA